MGDIIGDLEAVIRRYREADEKTADQGGLSSLSGLYAGLRGYLNLITFGELDALINEIRRARDHLGHLELEFKEVKTLKGIIASAGSRITPRKQRG